VGQLLRQKGKAAEPAVIPQLKNADARAAQMAAAVLADIGTEKSVPALQEAAKARDPLLAGAAREAIKKIQPETMDAVTEALLELEGGDVFKKREALDRLAKTPPDEARREKVATVLEGLCVGREAFHLGDSLGDAMAVWAGKQTVPRLLALLDKNAAMHERHLGMQIFARIKDERTVLPIIRWIIYDTDNVTKTLIEMGPVAEPELIKTLKDPNPTARTAAARVLQEVGTVRSVATLKRASLDQRDPGAAAAARVALDVVSERVKAAKATATTGPTGK
jgi:HEAT repeat protein